MRQETAQCYAHTSDCRSGLFRHETFGRMHTVAMPAIKILLLVSHSHGSHTQAGCCSFEHRAPDAQSCLFATPSKPRDNSLPGPNIEVKKTSCLQCVITAGMQHLQVHVRRKPFCMCLHMYVHIYTYIYTYNMCVYVLKIYTHACIHTMHTYNA